METMTLTAEVREERGKGPARRLRAAGKLPAVIYGPGLDPQPISLDPAPLIKGLRSTRGRNVVYDLTYGGNKSLAMVKDLVVDPVTRSPLHVDFLKVTEDTDVLCDIPVRATGRAIGVVKGGALNVTMRSVPVRTKPGNIPEGVTIDVTALDLFGTIVVSELPLPEGCECTLRPDLTVAIVLENKRARKAAEEAAKAAEAAG